MKNILVLTFWSFKEPLLQSGALPYLRIISEISNKDGRIFLFTLEKEEYKISKEEREKISQELDKNRITLISKKYYRFGIKSLLAWPIYLAHLITICFLNRIQFIHCFGTPGGAIGYIISLITGKKLIIDCFEPHAEAMVEIGNWTKNSLAFRILFFLEKLQARKAYAVLMHSPEMVDYVKEKYNTCLNKYFIRSNLVDLKLFNTISTNKEMLRFELGIKKNEIVCIYSGKIGGIYLENELFEFIISATHFWKDRFRIILLTDTSRSRILSYLHQFEINEQSVISLFVPHHKVKDYLAMADFAICPVKPVLTKRYCCPIKTGEYWAMGLPVVIPANIGEDSRIIEKEHIGAVWQLLSKKEYQLSIEKINTLIHTQDMPALKEKIISVARKYRDKQNIEKIYRELYL